MAQENILVDLTGVMGVKDVTYDSLTNILTIIYDNDTTKDIQLNDVFLEDVTLINSDLIFTMNDGTIIQESLSSFDQVQSDCDETDTASKAYIKNKPSNVERQSDWDQTDDTLPDYIQHKPVDMVLDPEFDTGTHILQWKDENGIVHSIDFSPYAENKFLSNVYIDASKNIVLEMNDGDTFTIDSTLLKDTFVDSVTINSNGIMTLSYSDTTPNISVDISSAISNVSNNVVAGQFLHDPQQLQLTMKDGSNVIIDTTGITPDEQGGIAWAALTDYVVGDQVTESGIGYIAISPSTGLQPSTNTGTWKRVTDISELGGKEWISTKIYQRGDIVSDTTSTQYTVYISTNDSNVNNNPAGSMNTSWWRNLNTVSYTASTGGDNVGDGSGNSGMHNPNSIIGEYPNVGNESIGGMWTITGLGSTGGIFNTYTYTTGNLIGVTVKDGDRIEWSWGEVGSEKWLFMPMPVITVERGGLYWSSGIDYKQGDMVTFQEAAGDPFLSYTALQDASIGTGNPVLAPTYWTLTRGVKERGGLMYDSSLVYQPGTIVTDNVDSNQYNCLNVDVTSQPSTTPGDWRILGRDDTSQQVANEAALLAIDPVKRGDVVELLDTKKVFKAIDSSTGGTTTGDWQEIGSVDAIITDRTGTLSETNLIWAGSRSEYDSLGTYSDKTLYFIVG